MKMQAVLLCAVGVLFFAWGSYKLIDEVIFSISAQEEIATIISVGTVRVFPRNNSSRVIASYTYKNELHTERLHTPLFSNTLGLESGDEVSILVSEHDPDDARLVVHAWDRYTHFISGIFFALLGLMFGMIGVLVQKFGKE